MEALPSPALPQLTCPECRCYRGDPASCPFFTTQAGGELLRAIVRPGRAAVAGRYIDRDDSSAVGPACSSTVSDDMKLFIKI